MPNFWTGLGRMMSGKPIYDPNDPDIQNAQSSENFDAIDAGQQSVNAAQPLPQIRKGDESTFPVLQVRRIDNRFNGDNVQIYLRIYNASRMQLWLHSIHIFGTEQRFNDDLQPGEERQYPVYNGHHMKDKHDHNAKIKYRTMDGDYFEIEYELKFRYHSESESFECYEMHQHHAVRDIYG